MKFPVIKRSTIDKNGYSIGSTGPGGGVIFYYDPNGFIVEMIDPSDNYIAYYLEAAIEDVSSSGISWCDCWPEGCYRATGPGLQGTEQGIGKGRRNTVLIVSNSFHQNDNAGNNAAIACFEYRGGGKDDWFLPSRDELMAFFNNRSIIPNRGSSTYYWSSNQAGTQNAWRQRIGTAVVSSVQNSYFKQSTQNVRAIRAF